MLTTSEAVDFDQLLETVFGSEIDHLTELAEQTETFPRRIIELLGAAGIFEQKWPGGPQPDLAKLVALGDRLGRLGSAGIGVGVSLHDSAIAILRRFARNDYLCDIAESAIRGETVLCIGASEESGGSDLQNVQTEVRADRGGFAVTGRKKFVSLSPIADHILVVARGVDEENRSSHGNVALLAIPRAEVTVHPPYRKVAAGPLSTAAVDIDTWVPQHCLVARAGTGLAAVSWGLAHERLSIAAQVAGACARIIGITLARMTSRSQFGKTLYEHQALRLRIADLQSRVDLLRLALVGVATQPQMNLRIAAALKVCAARLGEEVLSECMHIFGGAGFLVDETPVGRWWRDMKLARIGGGTDEVLWELVAATMKPDDAGYRTLIAKEY